MIRKTLAHETRFMATAVGALMALAPVCGICGATEVDPEEEEEWSRMTRGLEVLWSGSPAEKRAIADDAETIFEPLYFADDDDDNARRVAAALREFVRVEDDDWIVSRLLEGLLELDGGMLRPVFHGALKSRSINVVRRGLQWFADNWDQDAVALLEEAWDRRLPFWARAILVEALANHGSLARLEDFMSLAEDEEAVVAEAAIDALWTLDEPRAVPALARVARRGAPGPRLAALRALGNWPDSAEALETLLEAAASGQAGVQLATLWPLSRFAPDEAGGAILGLARAGASAKVRAEAIGSLPWRRDDDAIETLVAILNEPPSDEIRALQARVLSMLHNSDDPAVLPGLYGIEASVGSSPPYTVGDVVAYLSRDRSTARHTWIRSPQLDDAGGPPDAHLLRVISPPGMNSVRCYEIPGVAGDPATCGRLDSGDLVSIDDYFERQDDLWVRLEGGCSADCWVPRRLLEEPGDGPAAADAGEFGLIRLEFDLPAAALESDAARGLLAAGVLETFDPEGDIVGAALVVDPGAPGDLELLIESRAGVGALLSTHIDVVRKRLGDRWPDEPGAEADDEEDAPPAGEE